ncbi:MAG: phage terminase small subunit P27 family [Oscillospiraceae bacterium]|nr:phage terminase small subunit P27 family [Oscillospiraceae bacterium]
MAGRPREPIDLIKAKGKKHLSEQEYEDRKSGEFDVPFTDIKVPDYLKKKKQKDIFMDYAEKLKDIGIMTELDVDCLARYVIAHDLYILYSKKLSQLLGRNMPDIQQLKDMQNLQDKAFKQAQSSARDLGLTITSRCKIVIPAPLDGDDDEL